jgi:hypothetical protein
MSEVKRSMLEFLDNERIFSVEKDGEQFVFTEECDRYYTTRLSKEQMVTLACEILTLAGFIIVEKPECPDTARAAKD